MPNINGNQAKSTACRGHSTACRGRSTARRGQKALNAGGCGERAAFLKGYTGDILIKIINTQNRQQINTPIATKFGSRLAQTGFLLLLTKMVPQSGYGHFGEPDWVNIVIVLVRLGCKFGSDVWMMF